MKTIKLEGELSPGGKFGPETLASMKEQLEQKLAGITDEEDRGKAEKAIADFMARFDGQSLLVVSAKSILEGVQRAVRHLKDLDGGAKALAQATERPRYIYLCGLLSGDLQTAYALLCSAEAALEQYVTAHIGEPAKDGSIELHLTSDESLS